MNRAPVLDILINRLGDARGKLAQGNRTLRNTGNEWAYQRALGYLEAMEFSIATVKEWGRVPTEK